MDADTPRDAAIPATTPVRRHRGAPAVSQLRLLELGNRPEWCLDATTREVGRRGVEAARAALRSARRPRGDDPDQSRHAPTAA